MVPNPFPVYTQVMQKQPELPDMYVNQGLSTLAIGQRMVPSVDAKTAGK